MKEVGFIADPWLGCPKSPQIFSPGHVFPRRQVELGRLREGSGRSLTQLRSSGFLSQQIRWHHLAIFCCVSFWLSTSIIIYPYSLLCLPRVFLGTNGKRLKSPLQGNVLSWDWQEPSWRVTPRNLRCNWGWTFEKSYFRSYGWLKRGEPSDHILIAVGINPNFGSIRFFVEIGIFIPVTPDQGKSALVCKALWVGISDPATPGTWVGCSWIH